MPVITFTPAQVDQLRPGDRITHLNGTALSAPLKVHAPLAPLPGSTTLAVELRTPDNRPANLYPDTHLDRSVTVERDEPAPARPRRPRVATRTIAGIRVTSNGRGSWFTDDRRYEISKQIAGVTQCEQDHPCRITPALAKNAHAHRGYGWAQPVLEAMAEGRNGFLCLAGSEHYYEQWITYDHQTNVLVADPYADSLTEAVSNLSRK